MVEELLVGVHANKDVNSTNATDRMTRGKKQQLIEFNFILRQLV